MKVSVFKFIMYFIALAFTFVFAIVVMPSLIADPDILGALSAGFVNPYSSGYAADVIFCWITLTIWVFYEYKTFAVQHGWICVILGAFPGVAVGFPLYLVLRHGQIKQLIK